MTLYALDNRLFTFLFEPRNHVETAAALTNQLVIALVPSAKSVISSWLVESSADYRNNCTLAV